MRSIDGIVGSEEGVENFEVDIFRAEEGGWGRISCFLLNSEIWTATQSIRFPLSGTGTNVDLKVLKSSDARRSRLSSSMNFGGGEAA